MIATAPTTTTTTTTTWAIDPGHTIAEFAVKHMMVSTTKGRFPGVSGTLRFDERNIADSAVDVAIDVATIITNDEKRDAHLRSPDFFDADSFPTITFKSTKVEPVGSNRLKVTGDLTIRDVTKEVVLDTEFNGRGTTPWGGEVIGYSARTQISRKEFGLGWNVALEAGGVLVGDTVKIALEVEAGKQA